MRKIRHLSSILFIATSAMGHPLDMGLVQLDLRDSPAEVTLDVNPSVAATLLKVPLDSLTVAAVQSRATALLEATLGSGAFLRGENPCEWGSAEAALEAQKVTLKTSLECDGEAEALRWSLPFVDSDGVPKTFQLVIRARTDEGERVLLAERGKSVVTWSAETAHGFGQFVMMGIEHIGAAPNQWRDAEGWHFPDGIDHILFVVALVLAGGGLWSLLATATGFTVGHSMTLALGALGLVRLPPRLVESAIALSIAFVAAEAFFQKIPRHRWKIATFFGLVHGLGFANAIAELELSRGELVKALLGFNLGVEAGQGILIALFVPLLMAARRTAPLQRYAVPACSIAVFIAGSYWFVERALNL